MNYNNYKLLIKYTTGDKKTVSLGSFINYDDFRLFLKQDDISHIEIYE